MISHTHRILVGANGWLHPAWQTSLYPDDLPEDWQLGYYSNEFPVTLLPAAYWQTIKQDLPGYLEDSSDELRIVCEIPPELLQQSTAEAIRVINEFIEGLAIFGEQCIGLLLSVANDPTGLDELVSQLDKRLPLCIESTSGGDIEVDKSIQKVCAQQKLGLCWHGEGAATGLGYGQLAMSKINSHGMSLRQLSSVVETMLKATTQEQTSVLIIDGSPPDLDAIRHTGVILDLF